MRVTAQVALTCAVAVAVGLSAWSTFRDEADSPETPSERSVDVGFVRDMAVHHDQGVAMAEIIHRRSDEDPFALFASDISLGQQSQLGRFYGWLEQWDVPPTGSDPMGWMSHGGGRTGLDGSMSMPGLASREQVSELTELPVEDAEAEFLRLMIAHHRGAVSMAEAVLDLQIRPEVRRIAQAILSTQRAEIDAMNGMLEARGQEPM